jgi:hypothetical protein
MTKTHGAPRAADQVADHLRRRGVHLDSQRLDEQVAAQHDRDRRAFNKYRDRVELLALAARKSRRAAQLAETAWLRKPGPDTLQEAQTLRSAYKASQEALRAELNYDDDLVAAAQLKYGR